MQDDERPLRWRVIAAAVLVAWYVAVVVWALQPINDTVPTGIVDNQHTSQTVACNSPLSTTAGPHAPVPSLLPGRAYERTPCETPHKQYRTLFWIDTALAVIAMTLLGGVRRRTPAGSHEALRVPAAVG